MNDVLDVLAICKANNSLVASYKTMLEMEEPHSGLALLPSNAIDNILSNHRMRSPLPGMDRDEIAKPAMVRWAGEVSGHVALMVPGSKPGRNVLARASGMAPLQRVSER